MVSRGPGTLGKVFLVALTGYGRDSDKQPAASAGFDFHLVKLVPFVEIKKILTIAAEKKQAEDTRGSAASRPSKH